MKLSSILVLYFVFLLTVQGSKLKIRLPKLPTRHLSKSKTKGLLQNIIKVLPKKPVSNILSLRRKGQKKNIKAKLPKKPVSHISKSKTNGPLQNAKKTPSFSPTKNKCRLAPALCKPQPNKNKNEMFMVVKGAGGFIASSITETLLSNTISSAYQKVIRTNIENIETYANETKEDTFIIGSCNNDNLCNSLYGSCFENTCKCIWLVSGFYCEKTTTFYLVSLLSIVLLIAATLMVCVLICRRNKSIQKKKECI